MKKQEFTNNEVVSGMAGLLLTILTIVESLKGNEETYTTEFILSQYNMTIEELSHIFVKKIFGVIDEKNGRVYIQQRYDPREMGEYDVQEKTFRWSSKGFRRVLMMLSEEGRYPADFVVRHFIGDEDPLEIINKSIYK